MHHENVSNIHWLVQKFWWTKVQNLGQNLCADMLYFRRPSHKFEIQLCLSHWSSMLLISHKSFLSQIQARFQLEVLVPYIVGRASLCVWQTNKTQLTSMAVGIRRPSYSEIRRRCQYCWDNQLTEPIHPMSTQVQQHAKHIVLPWTCSPVNPMIMTTTHYRYSITPTLTCLKAVYIIHKTFIIGFLTHVACQVIQTSSQGQQSIYMIVVHG